jgi:hypothetical protein
MPASARPWCGRSSAGWPRMWPTRSSSMPSATAAGIPRQRRRAAAEQHLQPLAARGRLARQVRLTPEEATRFMAPRCHCGFRPDHTGPPTALGPIRPLPIAWIMIENVYNWHTCSGDRSSDSAPLSPSNPMGGQSLGKGRRMTDGASIGGVGLRPWCREPPTRARHAPRSHPARRRGPARPPPIRLTPEPPQPPPPCP